MPYNCIMASLQASSLLVSSSCSSTRSRAAISIPKFPKPKVSVPKIPTRSHNFVDELNFVELNGFRKIIPLLDDKPSNDRIEQESGSLTVSMETSQLYAILEAVIDRIEMHKNMGEQRNNWNTLLLNSINMITLTAATMAGVASTAATGGGSLLALKVSSTLLLSSATAMLLAMNKIQPSQLVEEQRNATRLFTQLKSRIETILALGEVSKEDVKDAMERVLALDRAYPLPLIGTMLEKFPKEFKPATWWPNSESKSRTRKSKYVKTANGRSHEIETEMREVVKVVKMKDAEEYERLGNMALKLSKALAVSGPILTGISAISSAFISSSPNGSCWAAVVAMAGASLAAVVNTLEHGGQVGMVFEMYRNSAGFFSLMEETIESTIGESDVEKRENGELFEMKVALNLGRSLSQLRDLARKSMVDGTALDEFASKLF